MVLSIERFKSFGLFNKTKINMEKYTTTAIIASKTDVKEKAEEEKKMILSNDAYAMYEVLEVISRRLI